MDEAYVAGRQGWQGDSGARIDEEGEGGEDFAGMAPLVKAREVVAADNEGERGVGVLDAESAEGLPGVGRAGHVEFDVAGSHAGLIGYGCTDDGKAAVFVEQGGVLFPRVTG